MSTTSPAGAHSKASADTTSATPYRIGLWTAEFTEAAVERRFRQHIEPSTARHLQAALLVWAALTLLFAFADYAILGPSYDFYMALAGRVITALVLIASIFLVRRKPELAPHGGMLTLLLIAGFTSFFLLYFRMPPSLVERMLAVTMVLLLGLFVFLPNRLVFSSLAAGYAVLGTLVSIQLTAPMSPILLSVQGMVLLLPVAIGLFSAHRYQVVRRREFAALEQARRELAQRRILEAQLKSLATIDPLTGLFNRRHYEQLFKREFGLARRHGRPLALCILDLDHFKHVNDIYGHAAGDMALRTAAEICHMNLRETDVIGRLGGEEFVILLPETDADDAAIVVERIRESLEAAEIVAEPHRFSLTATMGLSELRTDDAGIDDLLQRADAALYEGKRAGRNRVCVA